MTTRREMLKAGAALATGGIVKTPPLFAQPRDGFGVPAKLPDHAEAMIPIPDGVNITVNITAPDPEAFRKALARDRDAIRDTIRRATEPRPDRAAERRIIASQGDAT